MRELLWEEFTHARLERVVIEDHRRLHCVAARYKGRMKGAYLR
jgi:hypothetical protein